MRTDRVLTPTTFIAYLLDRAERLSWEEAVALPPGGTQHVEDGVVERLYDDIARAGTVEMWLPAAPLRGLPSLVPALRHLPDDDTGKEAVTIWVEPETDGHLPVAALQALREGINIRPCQPIRESLAVIGDVVWSSSASLLGPRPGVVLRTEDRAFADAVRRAQRRRPGAAPGSGQAGDDCGRCQRTLIRYEHERWGQTDLRYECAACDRLTRTGKGKASRRR